MFPRIVIAFVLFGATVARAGDCPSVRLDSLATGSLVAAAQLEVERRVVESSVEACRTEANTFARVETVRERQFDGSVRWELVDCERPDSGTQAWSCVSISHWSIPLVGLPQVPTRAVSSLVALKVEVAQRLVELAYAALPRLTDRDVCAREGKVESNAAAMRKSFFDPGPAELIFYTDELSRGLMLERNLHRVLLQADPVRLGEMRVGCWDERAYLDDG